MGGIGISPLCSSYQCDASRVMVRCRKQLLDEPGCTGHGAAVLIETLELFVEQAREVALPALTRGERLILAPIDRTTDMAA